MTYLDLIFIGIIILGSAIAATQGLVKTVFGFASTFVSLVFAYFFYPTLAGFFIKSTGLYLLIQEKIGLALDLENAAGRVANKQETIQMIQDLKVPEFLRNLLLENNNTEIYNLLGIPSINDITEYISGYLATIAINVLSYVILFIVGLLIISIFSFVLDIISKLPVLKQVNHIGGFAVGVVLSFVSLWLISMVLFFITNMQKTTELQMLIEQSPFVLIFYENNLLLNVLSDITRTLLP